ncbi:TATA box-binding protein-associated factor RNA polymerase I subunit B-like [Asterias amurensis]|uniref:TATA box-binding protein-associated factor RNA polymerase I subunit B-like n=1 Tax=Asterias amurensis TaxID=7602 RepID=UPI003AB1FB2B
MPACGNCRQEVEFYEHGGLFYCPECETQSQGMRVLEMDDDYDTKLDYSRSYKTSTKKGRKRENSADETEVEEERSWFSCELFQGILKAQVKALVGLGYPARLDEVVMQLWFRFVSQSKLAFCNSPQSEGAVEALEDADDDLEEKKEQDPNTMAESRVSSNGPRSRKKGKVRRKSIAKDNWLHETDKGESAGRNARYARHTSSGRTRLVLWDSVCFMYLGLRFLKEPVLISDLLRFVREARLPLRSTADVISDHIAKNMGPKDINRFCNPQMHIPDITLIVQLITKLTEKLEFIPFHSLQLDLSFTVARMVHVLNLPVELCGFTHQLHLQVETFSTTPTKDPRHKSTKGNKILEAPAVECQALAYIIIALKLMLILDDHSEHNLSLRTSGLQSLFPTDVKLFNWDGWVAAQKLRVGDRIGRDGTVTSASDINKVRNMDGFLRHFKSFYQVEQVHKHFHQSRHKLLGRQDILKEFQRPFRALHEKSSNSQEPSFHSSQAFSQSQQQQDSYEDGHEDDEVTSENGEDVKNSASTDLKWLSRNYLLQEDFSKHTLRHLTNLQDLCEQHIISPESVRRVLDAITESESNNKDSNKKASASEDNSRISDETSSDEESSSGKSSRGGKRKRHTNINGGREQIPSSQEAQEGGLQQICTTSEVTSDEDRSDKKTGEQLKPLYVDNWNRKYMTYPYLSKRKDRSLSLEHRMDCFHLSMDWLLSHCSQICETKTRRLYCHVRDIEKVLFHEGQ